MQSCMHQASKHHQRTTVHRLGAPDAGCGANTSAGVSSKLGKIVLQPITMQEIMLWIRRTGCKVARIVNVDGVGLQVVCARLVGGQLQGRPCFLAVRALEQLHRDLAALHLPQLRIWESRRTQGCKASDGQTTQAVWQPRGSPQDGRVMIEEPQNDCTMSNSRASQLKECLCMYVTCGCG